MNLRTLKDRVQGALKRWRRNRKGDAEGGLLNPIPREKDSEVASFVVDLFADGVEWERRYWGQTAHLRVHRPGYNVAYTPEEFRRGAGMLATYNNWELWGHRTQGVGNAWKQERVAGGVPRQMRVRRDYILGAWHAITVLPNIGHLDAVLMQERERMGWSDWLTDFAGRAQQYGRSYNRIVLDYESHPEGQVRYEVYDDDSLVRTPGSRGFGAHEGCWYVAMHSQITDKQAEQYYPELDAADLQGTSSRSWTRLNDAMRIGTTTRTALLQRIEVYLDDPTVEHIPMGEDEKNELVDEQLAFLRGEHVEARREQNHRAHVEEKSQSLENLLSSPAPDDPDSQTMRLLMTEVISANIDQHLEFMQEDTLEARGLRLKYPNGRYICIVGDKVVKDIPSPLPPWRKLIRELQDTRVPGRIDGMGDPEKLATSAFQSDTHLSRIEDMALLATPKKFRHISDLSTPGVSMDDDNNPLKTGVYASQPPTVVTFSAPKEYYTLYQTGEQASSRELAVNDITIGGEPPAGASGRLVQALQRANARTITGELDRNLQEALKDIIEGTLEVMKIAYAKPREYTVNGETVELVVADMLSYSVQRREGEEVRIPIKRLEIQIKPGSNYPMQWENDLALFVEMHGIKDASGMPLIPSEAILDHLAQKYPDFGENGKYRGINQLMQIGLQALQQEQAAQAALSSGGGTPPEVVSPTGPVAQAGPQPTSTQGAGNGAEAFPEG